jgi:hypothetical protein
VQQALVQTFHALYSASRASARHSQNRRFDLTAIALQLQRFPSNQMQTSLSNFFSREPTAKKSEKSDPSKIPEQSFFEYLFGFDEEEDTSVHTFNLCWNAVAFLVSSTAHKLTFSRQIPGGQRKA